MNNILTTTTYTLHALMKTYLTKNCASNILENMYVDYCCDVLQTIVQS